MHDAPGFEVCDDPFDHGADLVDLLIELFLPVQQFAGLWLLDRRDHVIGYIPFVPDPDGAVKEEKRHGNMQAMIIVPAPFDRVEYPGDLPGKRASNLDIH